MPVTLNLQSLTPIVVRQRLSGHGVDVSFGQKSLCPKLRSILAASVKASYEMIVTGR
jgi:hypothetical protein